MTKAEFCEAMRTVASEEFAGVPADFRHEFSPSFERRMARLIRNQRHWSWQLVNTRAKRLVLAAALLLALLLTACAIPEVREAVEDFYMKIFPNRAQLVIVDDSRTRLEKVYSFTELPEGFEFTGGFKYPNKIERGYVDAEGRVWQLNQYAPDEMGITIDTGAGEIIRAERGDIYFYVCDGFTWAVWMIDGYLMELYTYGEVSVETMTEYVDMIG